MNAKHMETRKQRVSLAMDAKRIYKLRDWKKYSLFNLERILLASFLMSAIRSSSSALVSEKRRKKTRREKISGHT